jgi:hypothetical protein
LKDKTILTLLEQLIGVIRRYGNPRIIRTDVDIAIFLKGFV